MWHLKTRTVQVILVAVDIIKKEIDKHINKILGIANVKYKIVELLISLKEYYQCDRKISPKKDNKKHKYIKYI